MSIPFYDSFSIYDSASDLTMNYTSTNGTVLTTGGPFGEGAYECSTSTGLTKAISVVTELWVAARISINGAASGDRYVMQFISASGNNGGVEGCVTYNQSTGVWKVWRGFQNTLLGSFTYSVASGWHWIDMHFKYDGSAGVFEVWLDETQQINLTAQNTEQNSEPGIIAFALGDGVSGSSSPFTWTPLVYSDNTTGRIGDARCEVPTPNSDAGTNNGTPSTGTDHFACVDTNPWSSSKHITMPNTSGDKELYGVTSLASTPASVLAVKVSLISQKSDAGSFQLAPGVVSGGVPSYGSGQQLQTSFAIEASTFLTDPNTSAAWAYTAVNAMDIGYKVP